MVKDKLEGHPSVTGRCGYCNSRKLTRIYGSEPVKSVDYLVCEICGRKFEVVVDPLDGADPRGWGHSGGQEWMR